MRSLLQLLSKYSILLMFLALETLSLVLIVRNNEYQRSSFFSSANVVSAWSYDKLSRITSYFGLRAENSVLHEQNTALLEENNRLRNELETIKYGLPEGYVMADADRSYIAARVINIKSNKRRNYLTINKGERDSVRADMGVINTDGAVGIVSVASSRFAVVIPLINTNMHLSCKLKRQNCIGPLTWDGKDYRFAYMEDIAKHIEVSKGDTIVTSGYTMNFPEDLPVGIVEDVATSESDAYHKIKVRLAVNYNSIRDVTVIKNNTFREQTLLEQTEK